MRGFLFSHSAQIPRRDSTRSTENEGGPTIVEFDTLRIQDRLSDADQLSRAEAQGI